MARKHRGKKFSLIFNIILVLFVGVLLFFSMRPVQVSLTDEGLQIHGMYGQTIAWEEITKIEVADTLPTIQLRTNGSAIGSRLHGHFRTAEYGSVKLFVDKSQPPFIYITTEKQLVIINLDNPEATQKLAADIAARL